MFRRLLILGFLTYVTIWLTRTSAKRAADGARDQTAREDWDSEGGAPPPDPVDTPIRG